MSLARGLMRSLSLATGAWLGYAWLPHLLTLGCVWRGPRTGHRIALTFDDGPDPEWTPRILELLTARRVRGTFFVIGARAARHPGLVRALAEGGHELGNHTWSHRSLWLAGPRRTEDEVARCHALLGELTGHPPRFFRPPWGMVNAVMFASLRRHGERCVFWSIQPEGLLPRPAPVQAGRVIRRAHAGAIVDLHDGEGLPAAPARLAEALPRMIDGLQEAGYAFATVGELLADGAPTPSRRARSPGPQRPSRGPRVVPG